jgi:hypothetical protein
MPQDNQLMSKHRVLSFKPQLRLEWRGQDGQNETEQPDHSASLGDSITASTQIRFSVHTGIRKWRDRHQSLNVGSMHPPQTQGKVQSAVRLALSGMYLLQASALTGLIDRQMTSKVPEGFILPIMIGLER